MLAVIYLIIVFVLCDSICRRFFSFVSTPHRLAAAFLSGVLISSWLTDPLRRLLVPPYGYCGRCQEALFSRPTFLIFPAIEWVFIFCSSSRREISNIWALAPHLQITPSPFFR